MDIYNTFVLIDHFDMTSYLICTEFWLTNAQQAMSKSQIVAFLHWNRRRHNHFSGTCGSPLNNKWYDSPTQKF